MAPAEKKRQADPHYRELCSGDTAALKGKVHYERAAGGSETYGRRSTAQTWAVRAMSERVAEDAMAGKNPHSVMLTFDGARIGRPAVEILMCVAELKAGVLVLPPAVLRSPEREMHNCT